MKKETPIPKLSSIDFCIHTQENPEALEKLLISISKQYPGAQIIVADSAVSVDRAYYKKLRKEMAEAGLLNRITIHGIPYNAGMAKARNFFLSNAKSQHVLMLDQSNVVTKETDVLAMATVLASNKNIGLVSGAMTGFPTPKTEDKKPMHIGDLTFIEAPYVSPFMMVKRDIGHYIRWNHEAENTHSDFCNRMETAPFIMVYTEDVNIDVSTPDEETQESDSPSGSNTPEQPVPTEHGDAGGDAGADSVPSGEPEKEEDISNSGAEGGSKTRPTRGKGNK